MKDKEKTLVKLQLQVGVGPSYRRKPVSSDVAVKSLDAGSSPA